MRPILTVRAEMKPAFSGRHFPNVRFRQFNLFVQVVIIPDNAADVNDIPPVLQVADFALPVQFGNVFAAVNGKNACPDFGIILWVDFLVFVSLDLSDCAVLAFYGCVRQPFVFRA